VKLSDRLVFPEQSSIEACAKAGRSRDTFGGLYSWKAPDYSKKQKTSFRQTFVYL
jgi:hypothetical protein